MKISMLLEQDLIMLDLNICQKKEAIKKMVKRLHKKNYITSPKEFYKEIKSSEDKGYINIGNGILIPHVQSSLVNQAAVVILRTSQDLNCKGLDGKPAQLFFMIAVPEDKPDRHLAILSRLSRKLIYPSFRNRLFKADSALEIMSIMRGEKNVS